MTRKLIFSILTVLPLALFSQSNAQLGTFSPYSIYGLGQSRYQGGLETLAMGGVNAAYSSPVNINIANPASLSRLGVTTYALGGIYENVTYQTDAQKERSNNLYVSQIAMGIPFGKWGGMSFGLMPYTTVGYDIVSNSTVSEGGEELERVDRFNGNGGLNNVYLAYGVNVFKGFSLGVNASYLFGSISRNSTYGQEGVLLLSTAEERSQLSGWEFMFGAQYDVVLVNNTRLFLGGTYGISNNVKSSRTLLSYTSDVSNTRRDHNSERFEELAPVYFKLPQAASVSVTVGDPLKWNLGAQVDWREDPEIEKVDFGESPAEYRESYRYGFGGYYIPNYKSLTSYMSRVTYRFGAYYDDPGLVVDGTNITDWGLTLGFAFPISSKTLSTANLVLNYGQFGTTDNNLVKENYFKVGITLSLNDRWFIKRKFF